MCVMRLDYVKAQWQVGEQGGQDQLRLAEVWAVLTYLEDCGQGVVCCTSAVFCLRILSGDHVEEQAQGVGGQPCKPRPRPHHRCCCCRCLPTAAAAVWRGRLLGAHPHPVGRCLAEVWALATKTHHECRQKNVNILQGLRAAGFKDVDAQAEGKSAGTLGLLLVLTAQRLRPAFGEALHNVLYGFSKCLVHMAKERSGENLQQRLHSLLNGGQQVFFPSFHLLKQPVLSLIESLYCC
mmetsp:Transcript_14503/g.21345  ORF Transcript_14503/g.21345 Transcript_14503/m.21345 type:complete len:237 (-) Transcript_14503:11-721(-)